MIRIRLASGTTAERRTRAALTRLLHEYDLAPWTFTDEIVVDERAWPHSHPVLTLNTDFANPELLLAGFVHEQLHWFEEAHAEQRDRAVEDTIERYPHVPSDRREGAGSEESTRLHLIVCHLEHLALERLVGLTRARSVIGQVGGDHYGWIYRTVVRDRSALNALVSARGLLPEALAAGRPELSDDAT